MGFAPGHVFLIIGDNLPVSLPRDMLEWHGMVICDPWLNTACSAREYPTAFVEKMNKWNNDGKQIYSDRGWISPVDAQWLNQVLTGEKSAFKP